MSWIYWICWLIPGSAFRTLFGLKVTGWENLIEDGAVLLASNHESYIDPPLIATLHNKAMWYLARSTLFTKTTNWLYTRLQAIPVDQDRPDMASLKSIIRKLKQGDNVLVFPEGQRTHDGDMGEAAPGVGLIAVKSGVPIQPIRIRGAREALPRGSGRVKFTRLSLTIGKPIILTPEELKTTKGKDGYERVAKRIMVAIEEL